MKTISKIIYGFVVLSLVGCSASSSGGTSASASTNSGTAEIDVNGENTIDDYLSYKVKGVQAVTKIEPLNTAGVYTYIEEKTAGNVYVDVMLTIKNLSSDSMDVTKAFTGTISIDGKECETAVGAEDDDNTSLYENEIKPLQERIVHFYTDTAKENAEKDIEFAFTANNKKATMKVNLSDSSTLPKKTYSKLGDKVGDPAKCEATFVSVTTTKDISPAKPAGSYYSHYTAKDGITYLVLRIDYKNISGTAVDADKIGSMKVIVDSKYNYNGYACLELNGDLEYMSITSIKPLESAILYYYAEVPDEIVNKTYDMKFYVNSIEYNYTNKQNNEA